MVCTLAQSAPITNCPKWRQLEVKCLGSSWRQLVLSTKMLPLSFHLALILNVEIEEF